MTRSFRRVPLCAFSLAVLFVAASGAAQAQNDPPARVGRLSFTDGAVSFHDQDETGWSKAIANTPLTSGDAVWTEPNARSELSVAGTRVRLDGGTQLDVLALDDSQTRLQIDQGRLDIKTFTLDGQTPYTIATPRGTITLQQQGDYYVEAGSTEDATRLGVRSGAAQIQSLNGQTLAVRAGEVGEIDGDTYSPQLRMVAGAPPPPVPYWTARDNAIGYQAPPQYLSGGMTGYEDLASSGTWTNDSEYGQVWSPRNVPADWQPYRTGHSTTSRGATRPITTAAGRSATIAGSGCRHSARRSRSTRRRWSPSSAASSSACRWATRATRRWAGSRSRRARPMCRPIRPIAPTTIASTAPSRSRRPRSTIAGSATSVMRPPRQGPPTRPPTSALP